MASELLQLQWKFSRMTAKLLQQANALGYEVAFGEAFRDPRAIDLLLFKDGVYLTDTQDYAPLGVWWEQQGGAWGGRFSDGNHFSLAYQGAE